MEEEEEEIEECGYMSSGDEEEKTNPYFQFLNEGYFNVRKKVCAIVCNSKLQY